MNVFSSGRKPYVILVFFMLANYWIWRIAKIDLLLTVGICVLTVILFRTITLKLAKRSNIVLLLIFLVFFSLFLIKKYPYSAMTVLNPTAQNIFLSRHNYLAESLGTLYMNKFGTFIYTNIWESWGHYKQNFLYSWDLNLYFFSSHPLEREGVDEFSKFSSLLLPFFITGLIYFWVIGIKKEFVIYFLIASIVSGFINPNSIAGGILFFPIFCIIISVGLLSILGFLKK